MGKQADILGVAKKFRHAVRNGTGTALSADEIRLLHRGLIVSAIYDLEEREEFNQQCPAKDRQTGNTSLEIVGSGSETSKAPPSGASVGMTNKQEQRGVSQRGFGVITEATETPPKLHRRQ